MPRLHCNPRISERAAASLSAKLPLSFPLSIPFLPLPLNPSIYDRPSVRPSSFFTPITQPPLSLFSFAVSLLAFTHGLHNGKCRQTNLGDACHCHLHPPQLRIRMSSRLLLLFSVASADWSSSAASSFSSHRSRCNPRGKKQDFLSCLNPSQSCQSTSGAVGLDGRNKTVSDMHTTLC